MDNVERKTWKEFQEAGLIWWINRMLHLFGWVIAYTPEENGDIVDVYPARTKYRGFTSECEERGFKKVSGYLKDHIEEIEKEANE